MVEDTMKRILYRIMKASAKGVIFFVLVSLCVVALEGCSKPTDEEEISYESLLVSYVEHNIDTRELFDQDLFSSDTMLIFGEQGLVRKLQVDSVSPVRVDVHFQGSTIPVNTSYGKTFFASVRLKSVYWGGFTQTDSGTGFSTESRWAKLLERGALFYKLDSDAAPVKGWELVAVDIGGTLSGIGPNITIWRNPGTLDGVRLSDHSQSADLLSLGLASYTYLNKLNVVLGGDSIDIVTDGAFTIMASTDKGFRELFRIKEANGKYHFGFRAPQPQLGGRYYHLMVFQEGSEILFDSTLFRVDTTRLVDTLIPNDTLTLEHYKYFTDSLITYDSISFWVPFDTVCVDTTKIPPDTTACLDSNLVIERENFDTTKFIDSILVEEVVINSLDTTITLDSVDLPPQASGINPGKLGTFPFGVR